MASLFCGHLELKILWMSFNRAEETVRIREQKQREEMLQDFEQINIQIAGEDAGIDSEEECCKIEITPGDYHTEVTPVDIESLREDYDSDLVISVPLYGVVSQFYHNRIY